MPWMAIDIDVHSNEKILALADKLSINTDEAVGLMARLWAHAMRNSDRQGRLRHASPAVLAEVLRKPAGKAGEILQTLKDLELLDELDGSVAVHGWEERQAAWYDYQARLGYFKERRDRQKAEKQTKRGENAHVSLVRRTCNHTKPNHTKHNPTVPDHTEQDLTEQEEETRDLSSSTHEMKASEKKIAEDVIALYGELCPSLPKVSAASPRRLAAAGRLARHMGVDVIHDAFQKAEATPFLTGHNDRGWKATFDWLMAGDNVLKVLEGQFEGSGGRRGCADTAFKNQSMYTKEQFEGMYSYVFELCRAQTSEYRNDNG